MWGSEEDKQPIYIQSDDKRDAFSAAPSTGKYHHLLVTANLHGVLSEVRDHLLERVMWIDAICINQEDDAEKGRQVQSMAKIYACANRVIGTSKAGLSHDLTRESCTFHGQSSEQAVSTKTR